MSFASRRVGSTWLRRLATRIAVVLLIAGAAAVGLREVINSSTYQLFGDFVARIPTDERVVALTFDDGPHPTRTVRMLDLLDSHGVKATFFMMGRNVERYPDVAREVYRRGHEVGNHSYSHPRLVFMWPSDVRNEIERTDQALETVGIPGPVHFRAPHASKFIVLPWVLWQMGRANIQGDVDPEEWRRPPLDVMVASVMDQVRPGSIIGFHDPAGDVTLQAVDDVVTRLKRQGYAFETVSAFVGRRGSN